MEQCCLRFILGAEVKIEDSNMEGEDIRVSGCQKDKFGEVLYTTES